MTKSRKFFVIITLFFVLFSAQSLFSAENVSEKAPAKKEQTTGKEFIKEYKDPALAIAKEESLASRVASFIWSIIKYVFVLLLALGLAYFGVHAVSKMMVFRGLSPGSEGAIRLIDTFYLGQNKALHLVEVGDEILLISSSQNNVSFVKKITSRQQIDELIEQKKEAAQNTQQPFANILDNIINRAKQSLSGRRRSSMQSNIQSTIKSLKSNLVLLKSRNSTKNKEKDKF